MWFYVILGVALFSFGLFATRPSYSLRMVLNLMITTGWPTGAFVIVGILLLIGVRLRWGTKSWGPRTTAVFITAGAVFLTLTGASVAVNWKGLVQRFSSDASDERRIAELREVQIESGAARLASTEGDWPQWRGPTRDGKSTETGINTDWTKAPPRELWRRKIGGGYSSISVVGDRLYTMDRQGDSERIVCFACTDGKELWAFAYPVDFSGIGYNAGPRATPTIIGRLLYAVGATGMFLALELPAGDGQPKELWRHDLIKEFDGTLEQWGMACSPAVDGNLVVVQPGGVKGSIAAFDRTTGKLAWTALSDPDGYSSPVIADLAGERQVVAFTGEGVVGVSLNDGLKRWYFDWPEQFHGNIATPIVAGNFVFISSAYTNGGCALLEIVNAGGAWEAKLVYKRRNRVMANHHSTCVLHHGYLYGFHKDDVLKCVDFRTGEEKWVRRMKKGSLTYADGHLIILSEQGELAIVEATAEACKLRGKVSLFDGAETWAVPVLSRGRLYVRDKTEIVCLDLRTSANQ